MPALFLPEAASPVEGSVHPAPLPTFSPIPPTFPPTAQWVVTLATCLHHPTATTIAACSPPPATSTTGNSPYCPLGWGEYFFLPLLCGGIYFSRLIMLYNLFSIGSATTNSASPLLLPGLPWGGHGLARDRPGLAHGKGLKGGRERPPNHTFTSFLGTQSINHPPCAIVRGPGAHAQVQGGLWVGFQEQDTPRMGEWVLVHTGWR